MSTGLVPVAAALAGRLADSLTRLGRALPLPGGHLAAVVVLLASAALLDGFGVLLVVAATLLAADGLLPPAGAPAGLSDERFRAAVRARRRGEVTQRLLRRPSARLRVLDLHAGTVAGRDLGVQPVDLASVTGTVEAVKARQFDGAFRPERSAGDRWRGVWSAMASGAELPPVEVYRLDGEHYVLDGHHRVSAARDHGLGVIDARVVELRSARR